ncbi:MAG: serine/threonine protein kinase [Myxococcales bacterium]|nr:serine/threonine protein kinase [Myxococcales bacterium]
MSQPSVVNEPEQLDQFVSSQGDGCELTETRYQVGDSEWTELARGRADTAPWSTDARVSPGSQTLLLGGVLARGGMGEVRSAVQVDIGRGVAVKTVLPGANHGGASLISEARITSVVEHPNVVPLYSLEHTPDGRPLMIMKRIVGVAWRDVVRNDDHPLVAQLSAAHRLEFHLRVFMAVCDAIECAHSRGILHLDLKSANIMLGEFREVYVTDWGAAASLCESHRGWLPMVDERTQIIGTPAYMAPEMVGDAVRLEQRTDVYLLGALLSEILNKRPPHARHTVSAALAAAAVGDLPTFAPDAPTELVAIARHALQRRPANRYPSASALRAAVADFLSHRESVAIAHEAGLALAELTHLVDERTGRGGRDTIQPDIHRQIQLLLGECQFGFKRALMTWPRNPVALAGVERTELVAARYYLASHSFALAEAALAEFADRTSHATSVTSLRQDLDVARRNKARTERLIKEHERQQEGAPYGWLTLATAAVWLLCPVAAFAMMRDGLHVWRPWHTFTGLTLLLALALGLAWVGRKRLVPNRQVRRSIGPAVLVGCLVMYNHAIGLLLGHGAAEGIVVRCAELAGGIALVGLLIDRRYYAVAATLFVATPLVAFLL